MRIQHRILGILALGMGVVGAIISLSRIIVMMELATKTTTQLSTYYDYVAPGLTWVISFMLIIYGWKEIRK